MSVGAAIFVSSSRLRKAKAEQPDVHELDTRLQRLREELSEELERTREESRRSRYLGELAWTIEFNDVLRRTLDAIVDLEGVDAGLVTVVDSSGELVTEARGLSDEEAQQLSVEQPPSTRVQAMRIEYTRDSRVDSDEDGPPVVTAEARPIEAGGRTIGIASIFSRDEFRPFPDETLTSLEDIAARAGPALENARRYQEARRLSEVDSKTGLHNERYFTEANQREVARARRYGRRLTLLLFDLDDFKQINDRLGHATGDAALRGVAGRVTKVLRSADIACRLGGGADEFAVILHEATLEDAHRFRRRLLDELDAEPIDGIGRVSLSCGIAVYDGREEPDEFLKRADEALYRAKARGKGGVEPPE